MDRASSSNHQTTGASMNSFTKIADSANAAADAATNAGAVSDEHQQVAGRVKCKMKERGIAFAAIAILLLPSLADADNPYAVTFKRDVAVSMRDGITLRADIFRPDAAGKFPVLLQRTPYDKNYGTEFGLKA